MWVIAALRNHVFYSLTDMNAEITKIIERINNKKSRRLGTSRRALFNDKEEALLSSLPPTRYEVVEWRDGLLVPKDYHIACRGDYYSVPHSMVGQRVNIAVSRSTVKLYADRSVHPIAVHKLGMGTGANITQLEHMPADHRAYAPENRGDLSEWATTIGPDVRILFDAMLENKRISTQSAIRQMSRGKTLAREYGIQRLVSACRYANAVGTQSMGSVKSILRHDVDLRNADRSDRIVAAPVAHDNVRGSASYDGSE